MRSCMLANTYITFHSCVFMCYCVTFILLPVDRLPDVLKAESYAFVALPAEAFWDGQVNSENIKKGILCPIRDLPKTGWIHGITLFSKVCPSLSLLRCQQRRLDFQNKRTILRRHCQRHYVVNY